MQKAFKQGLSATLESLGFESKGRADFVTSVSPTAHLVGVLSLGVDADRYGGVRVGGDLSISDPPISKLLGSLSPSAQDRLHGRRKVRYWPLLRCGLDDLDERGEYGRPLNWVARDDSQGQDALDSIRRFVQENVQPWLRAHSDLDAVDGAAFGGKFRITGQIIRAHAARHFLDGHQDEALKLLDWWQSQLQPALPDEQWRTLPSSETGKPEYQDDPGRIEEFRAWLLPQMGAPDQTS